jgi:protein-S-isoprenylcysteine O-methyltransferase Ste14
MYINIALTITGLIIIMNGWYHIYHQYWKKEEGQGQLVKIGIYKYIRHPQYLGLFLISTGMLVEWMTLPLLLMFPIIIMMYVKLAKREEIDMVEEFGEDYKRYMEQTKMFIPKII